MRIGIDYLVEEEMMLGWRWMMIQMNYVYAVSVLYWKMLMVVMFAW